MTTSTHTQVPIKPRTDYTIEVFPHIRKYMLKNFPRQGNVFRTEESTILGRMVTLALRDHRAWKQGPYKHLTNVNKSRELKKIVIRLTDDQTKMAPRLAKLQRLNIDMDCVFRDALIGWIAAQEALGTSALSACNSFLDFYDIDKEKEYKPDTAYKAWQRSKEEN
jgi:hypothetical protein